MASSRADARRTPEHLSDQGAASRPLRGAAHGLVARCSAAHHRVLVSMAMLALVAAACGGADTAPTTTTATTPAATSTVAPPAPATGPVTTGPVTTGPITTVPVTTSPVTTSDPTATSPTTTTSTTTTTTTSTTTTSTTTTTTTSTTTTTAATTTTSTTTTTTTQPPAQTVRVDLTDFSISPGNVTIRVGDTVRWRNVQGVHTTTSGTGGGAYTKDGRWDSGVIAEGSTFSVTFTETGQFTYFCEIHPVQMQATVTVEQ